MPRLLTALIAATIALTAPAPAEAAKLLPPPGKVFAGVTGSLSTDAFAGQVGHRPTAFGFFAMWNGNFDYILRAADASPSRLVLHIATTRQQGAPEVVTPLGIARGEGDGYLLRLNRRLAERGKPTYLRLLSEMNQADNSYAAFDRDGTSRGPERSTKAFRQAWRRMALVLRGGSVARIDARLARLGLPAVRTDAAELPRAPIALMWVPQTRGTPDIRANAPRAYWPGGRYVDWVGTDFYSRYPNFHWLEQFYRQFGRKPFVFGEWALWGRDDAPFVRRLFGWIKARKRVKMVLYNQGNLSDGPFRLHRYPAGRRALKRALDRPAFNGF